MTTEVHESILHPASLVNELKKNDVSHVVWLPDSETNFLYNMMIGRAHPGPGSVCAAKAKPWPSPLACGSVGAKPVVLIQNTGIFEAGDSIRGLSLDLNQPLVMLIGYRGWTRRGPTPDSAGRFIEHILHAWGINYYLVETDDDADRISIAFEEAGAAQPARWRPHRHRIRLVTEASTPNPQQPVGITLMVALASRRHPHD